MVLLALIQSDRQHQVPPALSTGLDLWWADSVAALHIAAVLGRESVLTLHEAGSLTT